MTRKSSRKCGPSLKNACNQGKSTCCGGGRPGGVDTRKKERDVTEVLFDFRRTLNSDHQLLFNSYQRASDENSDVSCSLCTGPFQANSSLRSSGRGDAAAVAGSDRAARPLRAHLLRRARLRQRMAAFSKPTANVQYLNTFSIVALCKLNVLAVRHKS